jgi:hypothetical protein
MKVPKGFRINPLVVLPLLVVALVFILVLVLFRARIYTTQLYTKCALIGAFILFLALAIPCTRMGRDGITLAVMLIIAAVCSLVAGILA